MAESSKSTVNAQTTSTSACSTLVPVTSNMTSKSSATLISPKAPASSAPGSESDAGDTEFEPTAEMMLDEYDDERTLDEAEAEAANEGEDQEEEISNLQKEQDMPLEELLAMYGAGGAASNGGEEEEAMEEGGEEEEEEEDDEEDSLQAEGGRSKQTAPKTREARHNTTTEGSSSGGGGNISTASSITPSGGGGGAGQHHSTNTPSRGHQAVDGGGGVRAMERRGRRRESDLIQLYPEMEAANGEGRALRSSGQQSEDEDDDDGGGPGGGDGGGGDAGESGGEEGEQEEYRKTIMIGSAYQAQVPEGMQAYGATPPYENQDKLLWAPHLLSIDEVERYLYTVHQPPPGAQGVGALPLGLHIRDDEQALHLLLQCGGNVDEARRRHSMNPTPLASTMTLWSEEECRNFENGLKNYGKDFHLIQQNKVRTRSVGELVQFYYLWKKTERHDMFAAKTRLEKKKFIVHPGTTDYMDRFLDEGEGLLAAITNNNNNTSSNNNNSNQTTPPSTASSSSSNDNLTTPASASTASSNHNNSSGEGASSSSSAVGDGGDVSGNNNRKTSSSLATAGESATATTSNGAAGAPVQLGKATSARSQSEESNGVDFDDSSSNGSKHSGGGGDGARSGGGGTTSSSSGKKKDYVIPSFPPSETGKLNQQLWRENQRPNVAMHALLYGVLPAGYRTKDVSAALVKDSSSFKGSEISASTSSTATTTSKEVTLLKCSDEPQRPAKIPRLEPPSADGGVNEGIGGGVEKMEVDETADPSAGAQWSSQAKNSSVNLSSGRTVSNTSQLTPLDAFKSSDQSQSSSQQPSAAAVSSASSTTSPITSLVSQSSLNPSMARALFASQTSNALEGAPGKSAPGKPVGLKRGELILSRNPPSPSPSSSKVPNSYSPSHISIPSPGQSPKLGTLVSIGEGNNPKPSSRQGSPRISSPTLNRGSSGSSKPLARIDLIAQTLSREKALATGSGASLTSLASIVGDASNKSVGVTAGSTASSNLLSPAPVSGLGRSTNIASASSVRGTVSQFSGLGAPASEKAVL